MALAHSPSIVTNGLIFYYDMQNTQKSFKGAPTTNLITGAVSVGGASAFVVSDTTTNSVTLPSTSTGWAGYYQANVAATTQYTISFEYRSDIDGSTFVLDNDGASDNVFNTAFTCSTSWQTFTKTVTSTTAGATSIWLQRSTGGAIYIKNAQLEANSFATLFVKGTRSNTQAIIDLTGKNTITATSLTYNTNGTFSFNGTNNSISLGTSFLPAVTSGQKITLSAWINPSRGSNYILGRSENNANYGNYSLYMSNGTVIFGYYSGSGGGYSQYSLGTIPTSSWSYISVSHTYGSSSSTVSTINGVSGGSWTSGGSSIPDGTNEAFEVGHWYGTPSNGNASYWFAGNIGVVQVYNSALTLLEQQQNFNALRGRYGL